MPPTPTLVALDPPPECASSKPHVGGGGLLMLLMRGVWVHHRAIVSHVGFVGLRAHGPETQLMLMMLGLGGCSNSRKPRKYRVFCEST